MKHSARQSPDGGDVVCGGCKTIKLAPRVWLDRGVIGKGFWMVPDQSWYAGDDGVVKRHDGAWMRRTEGNAATRRDFLNADERLRLSRAYFEGWPMECACGVVNTINTKRLRIRGIAPHR
jgi:hypothetical protein